MKLRNHILLWLIVTSLLPLIILSVGGTQYNQRVFVESVDEEMLDELNRLGTKLDELFAAQRLLLRNLADSYVVRKFGAALPRAVEAGGVTAEFSRERRNLEEYFASLQQLIAEDAELRLLDAQGNTVIKASFGQATQLQLDTLLPYAISESEPGSAFTELLKSLPENEISHRQLGLTTEEGQPILLADSILPIQLASGRRIYLVFSHIGERLDRLLDRSPRLRDAKITVITADYSPNGDPLVLYDDAHGVSFTEGAIGRSSFSKNSFKAISGVTEGVVNTKESRSYVTEYTPYPDSLSSWVLTANLNNEKLLQQFRLARRGMLGMTAIIFLIGLSIAWLVSRHLTRPICRLANNLHAYAHNDDPLPDIPALSTEVESLQKAYHDMTHSLEKSRLQKQRSDRKLQQSAKLASIGEMAAGIGHELNNPLTNILSLGKLIKHQQVKTGETTEDIDSLLEETHRASKIVGGILNFSRQVTPEMQQIDLNPWIKKCIQRVSEKASANKNTVHFLAGRDVEFKGDPFQLEQVIINLLTNAIQASRTGQDIQVKTSQDDANLIIQVIDQGEGLNAENENRLFEPFFTTREVGVGNGLGLSISMGIIEVHDGILELRNNPESGCTAEIRLPLTT